MVHVYFDSLRRTVERACAATDRTHQKDEIVVSLFLAVTALEVFVNIYFRLIVTRSNFQQHEQLVIDDLDVSQPSGPKGIDYKLRHWPPKILGKTIAWQTGVAKEFDEMRQRRNALMHFASSHDTLQLQGSVTIHGLADTSVYESLVVTDAVKALDLAVGMVRELIRLRGVAQDQIPKDLFFWTGTPF
jgi:hypothetical protein